MEGVWSGEAAVVFFSSPSCDPESVVFSGRVTEARFDGTCAVVQIESARAECAVVSGETTVESEGVLYEVDVWPTQGIK